MNFAAVIARMVQEDLVVERPVHLERHAATLALVRTGSRFFLEQLLGEEVEVPELLGLAPAIDPADFDREVGGLDLVPCPELVEYHTGRWQQAFADMVTREHLSLEDPDPDVGIELTEHSAGRASARPAANDSDIVFHVLLR